MARIQVEPGLSLNCYVDDYLWPWDKAEPVVLLHGFARNADFWRRWVPYCAEKHRVYRPDLRGFGESDKPAKDYVFKVEDLLSDVIKVLDHFGLKTAHFAGESSGGIFSMLLAITYPDRVKSIVLCDTPIRPPDGVREIYALGEKSASDAIMKYGVGEWCRQTLGYRLDLTHASPELQNYVVSEMDKTAPSSAAGLHRALRESKSPADIIKQIKCPTLLLGGDQSKLSSGQQEAIRKEIPHAKFQTFPGYGHGTNITAPELLAPAAAAFWDTL